jgi:hypothetical protein
MKTVLESTATTAKALVSDAHDDGRVVHVSQQEVAPIIDFARARQDHGKWDSEMKPVAEIPMVIVEQMMRDGSWNDPAAVKRWLNDPQNDCFRIWRGRV